MAVCTLYIKTPCCHNSAHTATVQRVPDLPSLPHIYFADTLHTCIHTYMHTPKITRRWRMWLGAPLGPSPLAPHTPPSNPFFSRSLPSRPDKDGYSCGSPSPSAHRSSLFFFLSSRALFLSLPPSLCSSRSESAAVTSAEEPQRWFTFSALLYAQINAPFVCYD